MALVKRPTAEQAVWECHAKDCNSFIQKEKIDYSHVGLLLFDYENSCLATWAKAAVSMMEAFVLVALRFDSSPWNITMRNGSARELLAKKWQHKRGRKVVSAQKWDLNSIARIETWMEQWTRFEHICFVQCLTKSLAVVLSSMIPIQNHTFSSDGSW